MREGGITLLCMQCVASNLSTHRDTGRIGFVCDSTDDVDVARDLRHRSGLSEHLTKAQNEKSKFKSATHFNFSRNSWVSWTID